MLGHLCGGGALPVKKGRFGSKLLAKSMVKMKGVVFPRGERWGMVLAFGNS